MFPLLPLYINTDSPWHNDATYWFHLTRKKRKWKKRDTPAFTIIKKVLISAKSASCMLLQLGWGWHLGRDDLLYWRAGVNTHPLCLFLDRMLSLSFSLSLWDVASHYYSSKARQARSQESHWTRIGGLHFFQTVKMCNIVWFSFLTPGSESLEIFKGKKNVEVGLIKIVLEAWFFFFFF